MDVALQYILYDEVWLTLSEVLVVQIFNCLIVKFAAGIWREIKYEEKKMLKTTAVTFLSSSLKQAHSSVFSHRKAQITA